MLLQFLPLSICENMAVLPPKPAWERAHGWAVGYSATSVSSCTQHPHGEDGQGVSTASRGCENWALESGVKKGRGQSVEWGPSAGQHKLTSSTVPVWVHPCFRNNGTTEKSATGRGAGRSSQGPSGLVLPSRPKPTKKRNVSSSYECE